MIIGVTGGCGYVGSKLLPELAERAERVEYLDIKPPTIALLQTLSPSKFKYVRTDVSDPRQYEALGPRYDLVIHLAALVGYPACNQDPDLAERWNVTATRNVVTYQKTSARVLLSSTISNYGAQTGKVDETTPVAPNSVYGTTKKTAEDLVLAESANIVFRYAGAFGLAPVMRRDNLIHDFISRATQGEPLSVYESHFIRQFIHVEDMVGAICFAVDHWDRLKGHIYNVGNPEVEITKRDLILTMARHFDFQYEFAETGSDVEKRNYPVSFQKFIGAGFTPKRSLDSAISELIHHYQQQTQEYASAK
jgi:nucleoside-diphosphate-sugar epimerase